MESDVIEQLLHHQNKLLAYVQSKVKDPNLAEDVLQESLLKVMRADLPLGISPEVTFPIVIPIKDRPQQVWTN